MLEKEIPVKFLIDEYKNTLDVDVAKFFDKLNKIQVFKCIDTGYRFYYPFNTAGDSDFYSQLEEFRWYYMEWKWEHEVAKQIIKSGDKILEVGCGRGDFLKKLKDTNKTVDIAGLELNRKAVTEGRDVGLNVVEDTIEEHSANNSDKYDIVCSFQVLEHIHDIREFVQSCVKVLKPGGKLIISVPNNDSFIRHDKANILNMPPHHMGLWNSTSLKNLEKIFKLRTESVRYEPLQSYHVALYYNIMLTRIKYRAIKSFLSHWLVYKIAVRGIRLLRFFIHGHTILVTYKKKINEHSVY